jgi:gluconokinase
VQHACDLTRIKPRAIVIMGVSASGKSTFGELAAARLGCRFLEGDLYHLPESIAKMRAGQPLQDEDRWPWLDRLADVMNQAVISDGLVVATCSALKRSYRERLGRGIGAPLSFILLSADRSVLARRIEMRKGHYMPPSLLGSQLDALELPGSDEPAITLDSTRPPEDLWQTACAWLEAGPVAAA